MNISAYILEYLKQFGTAIVPGFGVFSLENSKAVINADNGSILPPASQIVFACDYQIQSDDLSVFISQQKQMTIEAFKSDLKIQIDFWKKKLQAENRLVISGLGMITIEDNSEVHFKGERLEFGHPDFYGLEEIKFSDINPSVKPVSKTDSVHDYQFNKSILWIFLIIIPVLGILYLAYSQQELLFGKKSFDMKKVSVQTQTHRIERDSIKSTLQNQVKMMGDSLKKDTAIIQDEPVIQPMVTPKQQH